MSYGLLPGTAIQANSIPAAQFVSVSNIPKISNVVVTNSSYVFTGGNLSTSTGGYITITGTDFAAGCSVIVGGFVTNQAANLASAVSFVSSTQVNAQLPALSAGNKSVYLVNTNGLVALRVAAVAYS